MNANKFLVIATILLFSVTLVSAATITRTVPSEASSSFQVTYTSSASGTWGASIVDVVSGGCKFPDGTDTLKTVMLSTDGATKSVTVSVPSAGTCVFSGDYKFGTDSIVTFPSSSVTIRQNACTPSCSGKECGNDGCGGSCGTCPSGEVCSSGNCISSGGNGGGTTEPPSFDINKVLFKLGSFEVTLLYLLILGGVLLIVIPILKK